MRHRPDTGSQGDRHRHGAPWFKIRDFRKANGVVARSSNYVLHGDMSRRVNEVYRSFADDVEIYSIDESFLDFTGLLDPAGEARKMRCTARQATGIPTCVGLGSTRVLAKVANHLAKKRLELDGVWDPSRRSEQDRLPLLVPAADVWRRTSFCRQTGVRRVHSATDLHALAPQIARSLLTVTGERLVRELTAYAVQSSNWSRRLPGHRRHSLPRRVRHHVGGHATGDDLLRYPRRGKLRRQGVLAPHLCVFFHTGKFRDGPKRSVSGLIQMREPTADTLELVRAPPR